MPEQVEGAETRGKKKEGSVRLFWAIPLWSEEFQNQTAENDKVLRGHNWPVKWVRPENRHITLKFLGNVAESEIPKLVESVGTAVSGLPPFEFTLAGLGGFPRLSRARILWVGVTDGKHPLVRLAGQVEEGCKNAGCPGDKKRFQPHLTLARSGMSPIAVRVEKDVFKAKWGKPVAVESVSLIKSDLRKGGAVYETVGEVGLS